VGKAIPLDNDTHWNSWFNEVDVVLEKCKELRDWQDINYREIKKDFLSHEDFQELEDIHEFLHPFFSTTKGTESEASTLDEMLSSMDFLIEHYKQMKLKYKDNSKMMSRIIASWYKFDKYYQLTDDSPVYAAAILLNLSLQKKYFEQVWAYQEEYIEPAIQKAREMWQFNFKPVATMKATETIKDPFKRWKIQVLG